MKIHHKYLLNLSLLCNTSNALPVISLKILPQSLHLNRRTTFILPLATYDLLLQYGHFSSGNLLDSCLIAEIPFPHELNVYITHL
jgi:hypothetical protein